MLLLELADAVSHFHNADSPLAMDQNESVIKDQLALRSWNPELRRNDEMKEERSRSHLLIKPMLRVHQEQQTR